MSDNQDTAFETFSRLIVEQFTYGGKKYSLNGNNTRESTDELFDKHGKNWLIGTIDKYCYRFKNLARERDLLKIATYCYILWLKRGFHIRYDGINDPALDTSIKQKQDNFQEFITRANTYLTDRNNNSFSKYFNKIAEQYDIETLCSGFISSTSEILGKFSKEKWTDIKESDLFHLFCNVYNVWHKKYVNIEEHDTDTNNEAKK